MNEAWIAIHAEHSATRVLLKDVGGGRRLGGGQLWFTVEITSRKEVAEGQPLWIGGELLVRNLGPVGGQLAVLRTQIQPVTLPDRGGSREIRFVADVDDRQLQVIENHRTSSVTLCLDLAGHWLLQGSPVPFWSTQLDREVSQSDWIKILEQTGYRRLLLVELDFPDEDGSAAYKLALQFFAEAQRHYLEHEWRHTVESLRQVLATLGGVHVEEDQSEEAVRNSLKDLRRTANTRNVGYRERYEPVRAAMKFLCDLGAHPEAGETSKNDAYSALLMVAGVLHGLTATRS